MLSQRLKIMRKLFIIYILFVLISGGTRALCEQVDDSIDDAIKSKFNVSAEGLPALPKTSPSGFSEQSDLENIKIPAPAKTVQTPADTSKIPSVGEMKKTPLPNFSAQTSKLKRGQKLNVKLLTPVSDRTREGAKVKMVLTAPVITQKFMLNPGTIIYGTVVNSHAPQILGNGGLVAIKTDYIVYNSKTSYLDGKIIQKNHRHVFFNNIKGNNGYIDGVKKISSPGIKFMKKTNRVSKKLWNGPGAILTPITYVAGGTFLVLNCVVAPFGAIFSKGKSVYLPKDTTFVVKSGTEAYIEY